MSEPSERLAEVGRSFLRLGCTSFGGPTAHFAYYRDEFVVRRRWIDEAVYAELLALMQLLPGPSSSQLAVALGIGRAGLPGGLLAWLAFTLPSALIMFAFALVVRDLGAVSAEGWLHGLQVVVVGVVAHAVLSMGRQLCPDWPRRLLALGAVVLALAVPGVLGQVLVIALGGLAGWLRGGEQAAGTDAHPSFSPVGRRTAGLCLVAFVVLLVALPLLRTLDPDGTIALIDSFYRAGALVFGGGHVVLPLLQAEVVRPGWIGAELFVAGYGAAQAMPGPLFSFAAYLGALASPTPWLGGTVCLIALYLPSMVLMIGVLPFWAALRALPGMNAALAGVGAAVVGLLGAVLIDPIWSSAIRDWIDPALAGLAFALLRWSSLPAWSIVIGCAALAAVLPT